ncbi:MAG TPA: hypothetical protein VGM54_03695 [Chthoniobacter sp.]
MIDDSSWNPKVGLHFIHYDGYPAGDDEWIGLDRMREKSLPQK